MISFIVRQIFSYKNLGNEGVLDGILENIAVQEQLCSEKSRIIYEIIIIKGVLNALFN